MVYEQAKYERAVNNALNQVSCGPSSDWYMDSSGNIKTKLPDMPAESFLIMQGSLEERLDG